MNKVCTGWFANIMYYNYLYCNYFMFAFIAQPQDMQASIFWARNRRGCGRQGIQCNNMLGCVSVRTLALVCVAAAGLLVVTQWEVWARGHQWLTEDLIKPRIRRV